MVMIHRGNVCNSISAMIDTNKASSLATPMHSSQSLKLLAREGHNISNTREALICKELINDCGPALRFHIIA